MHATKPTHPFEHDAALAGEVQERWLHDADELAVRGVGEDVDEGHGHAPAVLHLVGVGVDGGRVVRVNGMNERVQPIPLTHAQDHQTEAPRPERAGPGTRARRGSGRGGRRRRRGRPHGGRRGGGRARSARRGGGRGPPAAAWRPRPARPPGRTALLSVVGWGGVVWLIG